MFDDIDCWTNSNREFVMFEDSDISVYPCSYLLPHADMPLPNQHPGVVDRLCQPQLEHLQ